VPFDMSRANQKVSLLGVAGRGQEDNADGDDGEPRLAGGNAAGYLGLVELDLLDRQRAPVLQAATSGELYAPRSVATEDAQHR
jgi:hypothetical protein